MKAYVKPLALALFAAGALAAGAPAFAQIYKCVGAGGKTVYSQSPCPSNTKSAPIQERVPSRVAPPPAPAAAAAPGGAAPGSAAAKSSGPKSVAEQDADFRKRRADDAEAAKKSSEAQEQADAKQKNCTAARANLASLQMGGRQARINEKGERYFLDDSQVAQEMERAKQSVTANCS
ncbi:MAG TPA: DUF4124 domain-containing protein [Burkholderiales bacterium]|nr:DUF4124 domain-containing protein [Burkholderiales bacterium]